MRAVSSTYRQIIASGNTRVYHVRIEMTLADGTIFDGGEGHEPAITDSDIMEGTFRLESACSGTSSFDLGSAIIGMCNFSLKNFDERFTRYDFFNATATVWMNLEGDSEYLRIGFFTVDEPKYAGSIVSLELLDNMWKFDVPLSEVPNLTFPCTCLTAVIGICNHCGVLLNTLQFHGYNFNLTVAPTQEMNCREFLQYVAMITCNFCVIDDAGKLNLKWYDTSSRPSASLDGGTFSTNTTPYSDGDDADGGNFINYSGGDDFDGGTFLDYNNSAWYTRNFSVSVGTDEITITGVKFTFDNVDFQIGTDGYVLELENPLVDTSNVNSVLSLIWEVLGSFKLRTFKVSTLPDISAEVGDACAVKDLKGNIIYSWITLFSFNLTSQTVECNAVSPTRQLTTTYSKNVQIAVDQARKSTEGQISRYDIAVQMMNNLAVNALGAYQNYEDLETGGRVYYLSNKPITKIGNVCSFTEHSTVFKITGEGFYVSEDGGHTWVNGYSHGELVVNVLNAIGIHADWVQTGILKDNLATPVNYWNLDTGEFRLQAGATVGGKTVDTIAQEKASAAQAAAEATAAANLASAVASIDGDIADLQDQIDGNITTWFYAYAPTTSNAPASTWVNPQDPTDPTTMINHIGDLFYDSTTGYCYRWQVKSSALDPTHPTVNDFEWVQISDEDIAEALAVAQTAQDTADNKRRIFITEPVPPYDIGDTWMMGTTGDIKTCTRGRTLSEAYTPSDWSKLNKYTDDSALNSFKNGDYAQFVTNTNNAIDGKITTFYQTSAPTAVAVGDLWIDTDDGNKLYRWNGTSWASVQDNGIQSALTAASNAQTTADGKIVTYAQTSAPTGTLDVGDLWIDTDDNNKLYRWSGSAWVAYSDSSSLQSWITSTYNTDKNNLQTSIDGKAETWYQSADPSLAWTDDTTKDKHLGDLWYKTSDNTTWYYTKENNVYKWVQENVPDAVFDKIDGKAQIFTTTPTTPYHVGDLWCEGNTGDILTCTHGRTSGSYDPTDWEKRNKYTDDTLAKATYGTCSTADSTVAKEVTLANFVLYTGARISVSFSNANTAASPTLNVNNTGAKAIYAKGAALSSAYYWNANALVDFVYDGTNWVMQVKDYEEVFNELTNGGTIQGIFLQNGQLYINGRYIQAETVSANSIKGGTLKLGGNNNVNGVLEIKNASGTTIGTWNNNGLTMNSGSINLANNFIVNSSGEMTAKLGKFGVLNIDSNDSTIYAEGTITFFNEDIELSSSNKRFYYDLIIDTSYLSASTYINMIYTMYAGAFADSIGSVTLYRYYEDGSISTIQTVSVITYVGTQTYQFNQSFSPNNGLYLIRFNLNYRNNIRSLNFKIQTSGTIKSLLINKNDGVIAPAFKGQVRGRIQATDFSCGGWHFEGYNKRDLIFGEIDSDQNYLRVSPFWGITINDADVSPKQVIYIKTDSIFRYEGSTYYYLNWQGGSDRRIKENIIDLDTELSRKLIDGTVAKRFKYIATEGIHYGMIAQEAREVLDSLGETEAVLEYSPTKGREEETIKDLRAIRYEEYIPHLINYVKDLRAELDAVKEELRQLKEGK